MFSAFRKDSFTSDERPNPMYADLAGTRMRSGQSQIHPIYKLLLQLLRVFLCFCNLGLLACF
jgi:hypothetical protein